MRTIPISLALLFAAAVAHAEGAAHQTRAPSDIRWGDAPPLFPKGAKLAVLYGDPSKAGLFIVRLALPAGYKIAPHTHPTDENVTIVSGSVAFGMGDKLDPGARALPAGSFVSMPAQMHHFAIARTAAVVEVAAMGPFAMTYVNPADDPSKAAR
jgi:quercetin dioxygenase-like cupin family protein